jgi:hypothetical protein
MAAGWAALGTVRTRLAKQALRAAVDLPADAADAAQRRLARVLLALGDG